MRKSKYTDKQIVDILKSIEDGAPVVETLREKGISKDTYYKWKRKFNGMESSDVKKLRELERENAKLKKMYADMALANEALKDVIEKALTPEDRREAAKHIVVHFQVSITEACKIISLSKSSYYYEKKPKDDSEVINVINELIDKHPRNGFWLIFNRLRRLGHTWNHKRVYRVYKALGLNFKKRTKKRIPKRIKQPLQDLFEPNEQWSMDFMSDTLYSGKRYRILNIMDEFNRELIEFEVGTSLPATKVIQALNRAIDFRGKPQSIRVDNGPEFISHKLEIWCYIHSIELKFIQPGCPTQNSRVERFNGSMRREFFDAYLFYTLDEVKIMAKEWIDDYNHHRPHAVLGKLSPIEYLDKYNLEMNYSV